VLLRSYGARHGHRRSEDKRWEIFGRSSRPTSTTPLRRHRPRSHHLVAAHRDDGRPSLARASRGRQSVPLRRAARSPSTPTPPHRPRSTCGRFARWSSTTTGPTGGSSPRSSRAGR
jgi:hypothetical protein